VVSHSAQATSSLPSSPAVTVRVPPQSAHSGPDADPSLTVEESSVPPGAAVPRGIVPSISVVTRWQLEQVPVSTRASCTV
jgi:hypothetical protein